MHQSKQSLYIQSIIHTRPTLQHVEGGKFDRLAVTCLVMAAQLQLGNNYSREGIGNGQLTFLYSTVQRVFQNTVNVSDFTFCNILPYRWIGFFIN